MTKIGSVYNRGRYNTNLQLDLIITFLFKRFFFNKSKKDDACGNSVGL